MVDPEGRPPQLLQRVERARRVVSHCSQAAIRAYDEEALLAEASRNLVDQGDYCMAWFAQAIPGKSALKTLAHAAAESSGVRVDQLPWTLALGSRTPTMRALLEQRPFVVRNIPDQVVLRERYPEADALGFASVCAFPIQFGPHGAGVLTIYAREPDAFGPEEVALLRELAGDMAVGVSVLRARKANDVLEERLEVAERRFRSIVEHAPIGVMQVGSGGRVLLANRALATIFGYEAAKEADFRKPAQLERHVDPADLARLRASVAGGEPFIPLTMQIRRLDGGQTWVEVVAQPANGGAEGAVEAFVRDLTLEHAAEASRVAEDRQRLEVVRLQELDRMRVDFMGRASHELNTPLTPILLQVQALQTLGLDERQARGMALIERNVLRLAALVKDLLAASTLQAGEVALKPVPFDLAGRAAAVVESFQEQAGKAGIDLRFEASGPAAAYADPGRVVQVLFNLVGNALKFTLKGSVVVRCEERADGLSECIVVDTGRGFPQAQDAKLFEPFGRLHEHEPGDPGGTGLGLFISKAIVEQSGGTLTARSPGPGKGSVFSFTLPTLEPPPPATVPADEDRGSVDRGESLPEPPAMGRGILGASGFGPVVGPSTPMFSPEPETASQAEAEAVHGASRVPS